jgi:hypothetical protein
VRFAGRVSAAARRLSLYVRADAPLVAQMIVWRLSVPILKRCFSIAVLARFMWAPPPVHGAMREKKVERIRQFSITGGRLLVSSNCLNRSLTLYRLLSQAGASPTLLLGARRNGDSTDGHAWIELEGEAFPVPDGGAYLPVVTFGAGGAACSVI